ncbi:MAG: hypothetical protein WD024_00600 [Bacillota bacterium]
MRRLRDQGIVTAVVEPLAEADNPAAYALYASVGFRRTHDFIKYRKSLR